MGHWSFLGPGKKMVQNAQLQTWRTVGLVSNFEVSGHPVFRASSALDRGFLRKKGGTSLQRWHVECRAFISYKKLSKSAQYLWSSRGLVWWIDSANTWSIILKHGEIRCGSEWAVISKIWARGSEYVGTNTWLEDPSSEGLTAWSSRKIRKVIKWDKGFSGLGIGWIHEESLSLHNASGQFIILMMDLEEKLEHAESTHHLVTTRMLSQLDGFVDTRRSAQLRSEPRVILINMDLRYRYHPCWRKDLSLGSWYPEAQTATCMKPGKNKKSLHKSLRWWVVQALRNHTRWPQALRNHMRQSNKNNRVYRWILNWPAEVGWHSCR